MVNLTTSVACRWWIFCQNDDIFASVLRELRHWSRDMLSCLLKLHVISLHVLYMFLADIIVWTRWFVGASTMRDVTAKVVILGDSGVGKTSYAQRYVSGHFLGNYKFTVGGKSAGVTRITMDELNSLWLSDITWRQKIWSTLVQLIKCLGAVTIWFSQHWIR